MAPPARPEAELIELARRDGGDAYVALALDGALVLSQTAPESAVRRDDPETGLVTTLLR